MAEPAISSTTIYFNHFYDLLPSRDDVYIRPATRLCFCFVPKLGIQKFMQGLLYK